MAAGASMKGESTKGTEAFQPLRQTEAPCQARMCKFTNTTRASLLRRRQSASPPFLLGLYLWVITASLWFLDYYHFVRLQARSCAWCTSRTVFPQRSHQGSSGPLCTPTCPFGIYSPGRFLQPCNSEVLLAFPSASVIGCKRGWDTKVTLLSPRMDFLQLTRGHSTAMHSLLI